MLRKILNIILAALVAAAVAWALPSCKKKVNPTTIEIEDQDRHYYPILQGEELDMNYGITNVGDDPLIINEAQASCGCIIVSDNFPLMIMPRKKGYIHIKYNSTKNVGLVQHYIYCYGNIAETGRAELRFDVHVVPDADYTRDYEEMYRDQRGMGLSDVIEGGVGRGYYIDADLVDANK